MKNNTKNPKSIEKEKQIKAHFEDQWNPQTKPQAHFAVFVRQIKFHFTYSLLSSSSPCVYRQPQKQTLATTYFGNLSHLKRLEKVENILKLSKNENTHTIITIYPTNKGKIISDKEMKWIQTMLTQKKLGLMVVFQLCSLFFRDKDIWSRCSILWCWQFC